MDNLTDLKAIWLTAKTDSLPTSNEIVELVRKFRGQKLRKKWMVIIGSALLSLLVIAVMIVVDYKLLITYVGGGMIAVSGLVLSYTNIKSLKRFYRLDDCSNLEFLAFIEQTRLNQLYYYKKTQIVIMLFCSLGLLLYMYEPASKHMGWFIAIYASCTVYLLVIWLVVRPRIFKKNAAKLNATRQRLENISQQLK